MKYSNTFLMFVIFVSIVVLLFLNLVLGSVSIPFHSVWNIICGNGDEPVTWQNIIWKSRFPQALTALVAGAGLAISGLQMQTVFRNPLAGPSVLGISSGASMGVAFVVLLSGSLGGVALSKLGFMGEIALSIAAIVGSLSVMALIVYVSQKVKGNVTLLIIGVMIGYVANAVIGVLKFFSVEEDIRAYVIWGLGSFSRVSGNQMMLFVAIMAILIPLSFLLIKTLRVDRQSSLESRHTCNQVTGQCQGCTDKQYTGHQYAMVGCLENGTAKMRNSQSQEDDRTTVVNSVTALVGAPVVASVLFRRRKNELNE